jgi:transcriptional regulator with XRE-family HTH domain
MQTTRQIKQIIGENIRARRDALGLSRRELGRRIDADQTMIYKWEKGMHRPEDRYLEALVPELGVDYAWLVTDHTIPRLAAAGTAADASFPPSAAPSTPASTVLPLPDLAGVASASLPGRYVGWRVADCEQPSRASGGHAHYDAAPCELCGERTWFFPATRVGRSLVCWPCLNGASVRLDAHPSDSTRTRPTRPLFGGLVHIYDDEFQADRNADLAEDARQSEAAEAEDDGSC